LAYSASIAVKFRIFSDLLQHNDIKRSKGKFDAVKELRYWLPRIWGTLQKYRENADYLLR